MKKLNRRNWLKASSLATAAMATKGWAGEGINKAFVNPAMFEGELIRLSSNENPFGPSQRVKEAMVKAMDKAFMYPRSHYHVLKEKLAKKEGVTPDHILLVSGSNEGLRVAGITYAKSGGDVVTSTPTYKALLSYVEQFGSNIVSVPLDEDLKYDLERLEAHVSHKTNMIFFCNPNNPTGTLVDGHRAEDFCRRMSDRTLVFSDEAYSDYIEDDNYPTMVSLVKEGKDVIVSRTFSKVYGMAGVRVGYLVAKPEIIKEMSPKVMSYVHMMAVYGAAEALDDHDFHNYALQKNKEAKEYIYSVAEELGMQYARSHTNFVFINTGVDIVTHIEEMKKHGVLVGRPFAPLTKWCRVSTGTEKMMEQWGNGMKSLFG